tara:strand:- start:27 stop:500 length:474 start_codon:yes stop_codon:yes gene_type:complete
MASTITAANLRITITEQVTLNKKDQGGTTTQTISSINEVDSRIITVPSGSQTNLFSLSNNPSAGTFVTSSLKYARITNKDDSQHLRLRVSSSVSNGSVGIASDFRVNPGDSFLLTNSKTTGSNPNGLNSTFNYSDITGIFVEPSGSDIDVEYFIAST